MTDLLWVARSKFGKPIRLTKKVWSDKILLKDPELGLRAEYLDEIRQAIEDPEYIVAGWQNEYLALRWCDLAPKQAKYLCVVYREYEKYGFVITVFFISRYGKLLRRKILWPKAPW